MSSTGLSHDNRTCQFRVDMRIRKRRRGEKGRIDMPILLHLQPEKIRHLDLPPETDEPLRTSSRSSAATHLQRLARLLARRRRDPPILDAWDNGRSRDDLEDLVVVQPFKRFPVLCFPTIDCRAVRLAL